MSNTTVDPGNPSYRVASDPDPTFVPGLVLVWAQLETARLGEVLLFTPHTTSTHWLLGQGDPEGDGRSVRLFCTRQQPGKNINQGYFSTPKLSRRQLRLRVQEDGCLAVENIGQAPILHNGRAVQRLRDADGYETQRVVLKPGDLLEICDLLVFLYLHRPETLPPMPEGRTILSTQFGKADHHQQVGESPALWQLRYALEAISKEPGHVLIWGESGAGKELAAQAIHYQSSRSKLAMISRSAATFPEGLVDVELFGNLKDFPNPGMAERPGLVGQADGSSLFLDEIGELPEASQVKLLRVLDAGEYMRLGESTMRKCNLRLIAATNQKRERLRPELLARFHCEVHLPNLNARRQDVPLLVRNILFRTSLIDQGLVQRFFERADFQAMPRLSSQLMSALVAHQYTTHVRELDKLLTRVRLNSRHPSVLDMQADVREDLNWPERPSEQDLKPLHRPATSSAPLPKLRDPSSRFFVVGPLNQRRDSQLRSQQKPPPPVEPPVPPLEELLDAEGIRKLEIFRQVAFSFTEYGKRENITRFAASTWLDRLLFRAVANHQLQVQPALRALAGPAGAVVFLQQRLNKRLEELTQRQKEDLNEQTFQSKLKDVHGRDYKHARAVLEAYQQGGLR
jgi:two-component system nitrogen regulation response regulator GlnG/two-component system response regulator HydG